MAGIEELSAADQQAHKLGKILLETNPDIARKARRLAKEAVPTLRIPEVELEDQINAATKSTEDKIAALEQKNLEMVVERRREQERAASKEAGLDPDEVEKRLVDERKAGHAVDHSTMRRIMLLEQQTAAPTAADVLSGSNPPHTPIDMRPERDVRKLQGGALRRWSADLAHSMVDNFAKARRAAAR